MRVVIDVVSVMAVYAAITLTTLTTLLMHGATMSSPHYLTNGTIFGEKLLNINCVFHFLYRFCLKRLIVRRNEVDIIMNVHWSPCKGPVVLVRFQRNLNFLSTYFRKILKYQISWKIHPVGDGRTDMTKVLVAFRNFAFAPTKDS